MTAIEIDEHADADRIWATIQHIRNEFAVEEAELRDVIYTMDGELKQAAGDPSFSEYEIAIIQGAFSDLIAPGGLTKQNLATFQRLFDDLVTRLQDLT